MLRNDYHNKSRLSLVALSLFLFLFSGATANAQKEGIEFLPMSLSEAKTFSASTKKLIFIDCYTTWCGPCKWMSENIFNNDTVADFYNRNFLCLKMDMEKGEGKRIARKYDVKAYPTLLFLDHEGNIQERKVGASKTVMDYIDLGLLAMNPFSNLRGHQLSFESGARDPLFLKQYLEKLSDAGISSRAVFDTLYTDWTKEDFARPENFDLYSQFDYDFNSRAFKNMLSNFSLYQKSYGAKADDYLKSVIMISHSSAVRRKDKDRLAQIESAMARMPEETMASIKWSMEARQLQQVKDPEPYIKHAIKGAEKYSWNNAGSLNAMAWYIYKNSKDKEELQAALRMCERSLELQKLPAFIDTQASLYFKLGEKDKAIALQKQAITLAKEIGDDVKAYQDTLEFFKNAK